MKKDIEWHRCINIAVNAIMLCYVVLRITQRIMHSCIELGRLEQSWGVTEFLVNYQGGYVRRGLIGEIIYRLVCCFPNLDPRLYILSISLISIVVVIGFLLYSFKNNSLCWWVLPLNVCLMGAYDLIRKDFLCAAMLICIFQVYRKIEKTWLRCVVTCLLIIISLNIHECIFFMGGCFLCWMFLRSREENEFVRFFCILVLTLMMAIVCYFKGDVHVAQSIWESWMPFFSSFVDSSPRVTISSIGWDALYAINYHINVNFLSRSWIFYGWYGKPLAWCLTLFVFVNILFIARGWIHNRESAEVRKMLAILIFQFGALLPMFIFLSCDGIRICFYWTVSSLIIYFYTNHLSDDKLWPAFYMCFVKKIQKMLFFRQSPYFAMVFMLFLSVSPNYTNVLAAFYGSVVGTYFYAVEKIAELL